MITINLRGGLGNQLFQYAFGRSVTERLSKKLGHAVELGLDANEYDDPQYAVLNTARKFALDNFDIKARVISAEESKRFNSIPVKVWRRITRKLELMTNRGNSWIFNPVHLNCHDGSYHVGYWQSEKYFADVGDQIRKDVSLKVSPGPEASKYEGLITRAPISLSLHIRRTDYVTDPTFNNATCDLDYYSRAFAEITRLLNADNSASPVNPQNICAFIFSDNIEWARANLKLPCQMIFVSQPGIKDFEELMLMSKCNHHIIANSTFSWWGAWLDPSPKKIVIAPTFWANPNIPAPDIIPDTWIRI